MTDNAMLSTLNANADMLMGALTMHGPVMATRDNWADPHWLNFMGSLDTNTASNLPLPQDLDGASP